MTDLKERLREQSSKAALYHPAQYAMNEAADRIEELEDENNRLRDQCGGALRYAYRIRDQHPDLHGLVEHNVFGIIDVLEAALEAPPDEDDEPSPPLPSTEWTVT